MIDLKLCPCCGSRSDKPIVIENSRIRDALRETEYYVRCLECGLMTAVFDEKQDAIDAWNERDRSWNQLMEWIDEIYPAHIFDGSSGDIGPQIIVKLREINELRKIADSK